MQQAPTDPQVSILQGQLAWLVYFAGSLIGGRMGVSSSDENDMLDGELAVKAFQVLALSDSTITQVVKILRLQ